jgi:hypothetical protein
MTFNQLELEEFLNCLSGVVALRITVYLTGMLCLSITISGTFQPF